MGEILTEAEEAALAAEAAAAWAELMDDTTTGRRYENLHRIVGVEIFKAGKWNDDEYSVEDIDDIIAAFPHVGYRVPIKLGHESKSGDRAWGWVANLRKAGTKLLADFVDLPESLYKLIKDRAFDHVSSEIFWNIERGEKMFRRALKAVALLGADTPAVADLAPLHTAIGNHAMKFESTRSYSFAIDGTKIKEDQMSSDPGIALMAIAQEHMAAHPTCKSFDEALRYAGYASPAVAQKVRELKGGYASKNYAMPVAATQVRVHADASTSEERTVQNKIDAAAVAYMNNHPKVDYAGAVKAVLKSDPNLAAEYART